MSLPDGGGNTQRIPSLPLEIVEEIATHASGQDTLKAASTVSRAWLSAFRPKLFAHIVLGKRFMAATSSPSFVDDKLVSSFITSIKVQGILTALVDEKLLAVLNMLPNLESLELSGVGLGWERATPQSTKLLVQVLKKESLQILSVEFSADHCSGFPLALIPFCRRVQTLSLEDTRLLLPLFVENRKLFSSLTRNLESPTLSEPSSVALQTLKLSGTGLISRFAHFHSQHQGWLSPNSLERLELNYIDSRTDTPSRAMGELLRAFGGSVKMLSITVCQPEDSQYDRSLDAVDFLNLMQVHTLELTLTTVFGEAGNGFLAFARSWACPILRRLSMKETITKVLITCQVSDNLHVATSCFKRSLAPLWHELDWVLGDSFPSLTECSIVFKICREGSFLLTRARGQENHVVVDEESLENQFPRIRMRGIVFCAASMPWDCS
ncbi:hypothetical protein NP233_g4030 [Leucocoprinus birnbaumii]|uniref:F-box domain-containing protein n=1 Tax=Leucocoprinus birnbaumii TaxID=56174 RepID=A0AAD5YTB5_9AGAR|nr:hypothetical protein NP233_g4030 [Leucocoprinus birnbaumii]